MFGIARCHDLLNHLQPQRGLRLAAATRLPPPGGSVSICTGTATARPTTGRRSAADRRCDFVMRCWSGVRKTHRRGAVDRIRYVEADAQRTVPGRPLQLTRSRSLRNVPTPIADWRRWSGDKAAAVAVLSSEPAVAVRAGVSVLPPPPAAVDWAATATVTQRTARRRARVS
jgi:hypothetical protein